MAEYLNSIAIENGLTLTPDIDNTEKVVEVGTHHLPPQTNVDNTEIEVEGVSRRMMQKPILRTIVSEGNSCTVLTN